jgi:hypothetical protein
MPDLMEEATPAREKPDDPPAPMAAPDPPKVEEIPVTETPPPPKAPGAAIGAPNPVGESGAAAS